jgi:hypothetical protein
MSCFPRMASPNSSARKRRKDRARCQVLRAPECRSPQKLSTGAGVRAPTGRAKGVVTGHTCDTPKRLQACGVEPNGVIARLRPHV